MSRLSPFGGFNDLGGSTGFQGFVPFGAQSGRRLSPYPEVDPEEEQSFVSHALETGLGGLSYLGKSLMKPGRAIRGLLGGNLNEVLSVIPFSDSVGLTDDRNEVRGRDLLYNLGLQGRDANPESFGWGDAAGLGVEVLTDPLTYLGGMGIGTKLGKVLHAFGDTRGISAANRVAGAVARHSDLVQNALSTADKAPIQEVVNAQILKNLAAREGIPDLAKGAIISDAAEAAAKAQGLEAIPRYGYEHTLEAVGGGATRILKYSPDDPSIPGVIRLLESQGLTVTMKGPTGVGELVRNRSINLPAYAKQLKSPSPDIFPAPSVVEPLAATPLSGALSLGIPGGGLVGLGRVPLMTGRSGELLARYAPAALTLPFRVADRATEGVTGVSPLRQLGAWFSPSAMKTYDAAAQDVARFTHATEEGLTRSNTESSLEMLQRLLPYADPTDPARIRMANRLATSTAHGSNPYAADIVGLRSMNPGITDETIAGLLAPRIAADAARAGTVPHMSAPYLQTVKDGLASGLTERQLADIAMIGHTSGERARAFLPGQQGLNVNLKELGDDATDYFTRVLQEFPKTAGETWWNYNTRLRQAFSAGHQSMLQRDAVWTNIPHGIDTINEWAVNPALRVGGTVKLGDVGKAIRQDLKAGGFDALPSTQALATENAMKEAISLRDKFGAITARLAADPLASPAGKLMAANRFRQYDQVVLAGVPHASDVARHTQKLLIQKAHGVARQLQTLSAKHLPTPENPAGIGLFSEDVPAALRLAGNRNTRAESAAKSAMYTLGQFGVKIPAGKEKDFVSAIEFLRDMGLNYVDPTISTSLATLGAVNKVPRVHTQALDLLRGDLAHRGMAMADQAKELATYGIPKATVADVRAIHDAWKNPTEVTPILNLFDRGSNLTKTSLTAPFPAYHVRNMIGDLFNMWKASAVRPRDIVPVFKGAYEALRGRASPEMYRELIGTRSSFVPHATANADLLGQAGERLLSAPSIPTPATTNVFADLLRGLRDYIPQPYDFAKGKMDWGRIAPWNVQGVASETDRFAPVVAGRRLGESLSNFMRTAHFLGQKKQAAEAVGSQFGHLTGSSVGADVLRHQLDYGNATHFEQNVARRLIPWWMFSSRNLPSTLHTLANNPGKLTIPLHVMTGARTPYEFVPPNIAQGASIPIPGADDGKQRYISSFGLPFEDEAVRIAASLGKGEVTKALVQGLGMTQPFIRAPLELAFGKQLYNARDLEDMPPSPFFTAAGIGPETARKLTQAVSMTPLSRGLTTSAALVDPKKDLGPTLVNLLSGVRISDVNAETQREVAAKKLIGSLMAGRTGVRDSEGVYLGRDALEAGQVSPDVLRLYRMYLNANERLRVQAEARLGK